MKRATSETKSRAKSPRLAVVAATRAATKRNLKIVNIEDAEPALVPAVLDKDDDKKGPYLYENLPIAMSSIVLMVICYLVASNWYKIPIMIGCILNGTVYMGFPWKDEADTIAFKTSPGELLIHTINAFALAIVASLLLCRLPSHVRRVLCILRMALYIPFVIVVVKNLNHLGPMSPEMAVANNLLLTVLLHASISWSNHNESRIIGAHREWHVRHADLVFFVTLMMAPAAELANRIVYEMSR